MLMRIGSAQGTISTTYLAPLLWAHNSCVGVVPCADPVGSCLAFLLFVSFAVPTKEHSIGGELEQAEQVKIGYVGSATARLFSHLWLLILLLIGISSVENDGGVVSCACPTRLKESR